MKNKTDKKIELLCPAGDLERLKTAVVFGADAVYCGLPDFSLRNPREITFTLKTLKEGIEFAHKKGVKVYVTFNVFPHEGQIDNIKKILKNIKEILFDIDGFIVSDLGMFSLVKKEFPNASIHISTQANTINSQAVLEWKKLGADRVVLGRELTLKEIAEIKKKVPSVELEVFGHGAMCMAYSGRCLLSKYFTGREANLGDCAQSCRWKYRIKNNESRIKNSNSKFQIPDSRFFLEEETRPGDLIEVQEDPNGTYFMNSKEICSIDILDRFIEAGINSLKIEGRAKTVYYLATVTRAYRKAIDAYYELNQKSNLKNQKFGVASPQYKKYKLIIDNLRKEFDLIQNRGYSHGFLLGRHDYEQEYDIAAFKPNVMFIGIIQNSKIKNKKSGVASPQYLVEVKNKFKAGEEIEIVTPGEIIKTKIIEIKDEKGKILQEILKPQEKVWIRSESRIKNKESRITERSILRKITKKE